MPESREAPLEFRFRPRVECCLLMGPRQRRGRMDGWNPRQGGARHHSVPAERRHVDIVAGMELNYALRTPIATCAINMGLDRWEC